MFKFVYKEPQWYKKIFLRKLIKNQVTTTITATKRFLIVKIDFLRSNLLGMKSVFNVLYIKGFRFFKQVVFSKHINRVL